MYRWLNPLNGFDQIKKPKEVKEIIEISKDIIEESNESRRIPCIAQRMVAFQLLQPRRSPEEIQRNTINKSTI